MEQKNKTRYFGPVFLLLAIVFTIVIYKTNGTSTQDIRSSAEDADPNFCQNQCAGRNRCDLNDTTRTDDPNLNDPCCEDIARTGDPGACPWPQRGYCTVDQCNAIPEGVNRQRCGGPRWQWCENCKAQKCPGYGASPSPTPTQAVLPTASPSVTLSLPAPTEVPSPTVLIEPTSPQLPTQIIQLPKPGVTYIPAVFPTNPPAPTLMPTSAPFQFSLPQILPPKEKMESFFITVKTNLQNFFSKILP